MLYIANIAQRTFENGRARRVHVQGTDIHGVYNLTGVARCTIMASLR